jgi:hypothetical protein
MIEWGDTYIEAMCLGFGNLLRNVWSGQLLPDFEYVQDNSASEDVPGVSASIAQTIEVN